MNNQPTATPQHCGQKMSKVRDFENGVTEWQCDECKTRMLLSWVSSETIGHILKGMFL